MSSVNYPVNYGAGLTALDATKAQAMDAANRAGAAAIDRAEYESTAYNTTAHARAMNIDRERLADVRGAPSYPVSYHYCT